MKILKRVIVVFVGLFAVVFVGAYFLPSTVSLSREVVIAAPASKIFPHINDLKKNQVWSPWAQMGSEMKLVFSGPANGVGQKSTWHSDNSKVGTGSQEITASMLNTHVTTKLNFGEMGTATAAWDLEKQGSNTKVIWSFETDLGNNPVMRWMGLRFDSMIGSDYEAGLAKLKTIVEAEK